MALTTDEQSILNEFDERKISEPNLTVRDVAGEFFRRPIQPIEQAPERGFIKRTAVSLGQGVLDIGIMGADVVRGLDRPGGFDFSAPAERFKETLETVREKPFFRREEEPGAFQQAVQAAPPSLGVLGLAGVGAAVGSLAGPVGTAVGAALGAGAGLIGFGVAKGQSVLDETENFIKINDLDNTDPERAAAMREAAKTDAVLNGATEFGLEAAALGIDALTFGVGRVATIPGKALIKQTLRNAFKPTFGQIAKQMAIKATIVAGAEVGTEVTQEAISNEFRKDIGIDTQSTFDAASAAVGPAAILSLMFFGVGQGYTSVQKFRMKNALKSASITPERRFESIDTIAKTIKETPVDLTIEGALPKDNVIRGEVFQLIANDFVETGQDINLDFSIDQILESDAYIKNIVNRLDNQSLSTEEARDIASDMEFQFPTVRKRMQFAINEYMKKTREATFNEKVDASIEAVVTGETLEPNLRVRKEKAVPSKPVTIKEEKKIAPKKKVVTKKEPVVKKKEEIVPPVIKGKEILPEKKAVVVEEKPKKIIAETKIQKTDKFETELKQITEEDAFRTKLKEGVKKKFITEGASVQLLSKFRTEEKVAPVALVEKPAKVTPVQIPQKPTQPEKFFVLRETKEGGSEFIETKGTQVLNELGDFFVHGSTKEGFSVTEGQTGVSIATGIKKKDVIAKAKIEISTRPGRQIQEAISFSIETSGLSPRFAPIKERPARIKTVDKARANIKSKLSGPKLGVDPTVIADMAIVGAHHIRNGAKTFTEFSKRMIKDFGDKIKSFLLRAWSGARREFQRFLKEETGALRFGKDITPKPVEKKAEKAAAKPEVAKEPVRKPKIKAEQREENIFKDDPALTSEQKASMDESIRNKQAPDKILRESKSVGERIADYLGMTTTFSPKTIKTFFRQKIVDRYEAIRQVSDKAWKMAHQSNHAVDVVHHLFTHGKMFLTKEGATSRVKDKETLTGGDVNKGMSFILKPVLISKTEFRKFISWITANRSIQLQKQTKKAKDKAGNVIDEPKYIEKNFTPEEIDAMLKLDQGKMANGESRAKVFAEVNKGIIELNNNVLDLGIESGYLNKNVRDLWVTDFFSPFYRVLNKATEAEGFNGMPSRDSLVNQPEMLKIRGSALPIDEFMTNIAMNWNSIINGALKTKAANKAIRDALIFADGTKKEGKDKDALLLIEKITTEKAKNNPNAIFTREEGKKVFYQVNDNLLLESLTMMHQKQWDNNVLAAARKFKRLLTFGVTLSPEFQVANLIRDSITAIGVSNVGINPFANISKGFKATKKDSESQITINAAGGNFDLGHVYGNDLEIEEARLSRKIKNDTVLDNSKGIARYSKTIKGAFGRWTALSSRIENINRAARFEETFARTGSLLEAGFAAKDLLNFSSFGASPAVRVLIDVIPFLNARIQGLDVLARAATSKDAITGVGKTQRRRLMLTMGTVAVSSIALYLAFKDDDDFKQREDFDRDTYWWFKVPGTDTAFRIPKPFEIGLLGTMAERFVEQIVSDEVHGELFAERLGFAIGQTLAFNPVPQIIKPVVELYANKNMFTKRPIETLSMQNLSPSERKKVWTSQTTILMSQGLSKIPWDKVQLSPVQMESLVKGYFGWLGARVLGLTDTLFARPISGAPTRPALRINDFPLLGRFIRESPERNSRYVTVFFDQLTAANQAYNDIKQFRLFGEDKKAFATAKKNRKLLQQRIILNRTRRELSKISKRIKIVARSNKTPAEKKIEINRLTQIKNNMAKFVVEATR